MERQYIFHRTARGCLVFLIGVAALALSVVALTVLAEPTMPIIAFVVFAGIGVVVHLSFKYDE